MSLLLIRPVLPLVNCFLSRALIDLMQFVERLEESTKLVNGLFLRIHPLLRSSDNRVRETTIVTVGLIGK